MEEKISDPTPKKPIKQQFIEAIKSPMTALSGMTKESPLITIMAIVFVLQPVISTGIDLVHSLITIKEDLDPSSRPVTKAELDIVNAKIDFNNQMLIALMQSKKDHDHINHDVVHITPPTTVDPSPKAVVPYDQLQKQLKDVQSKLDDKFKHTAKK